MGKRSDSSESGTPDWLRKRREKGSTIPRDGEGKGGGKGKFKDGDKDGGKGGGKERRPGDWECPDAARTTLPGGQIASSVALKRTVEAEEEVDVTGPGHGGDVREA
eukprot:CAMPEP_0178416468 /NCGR_PEP_ID=MMETSP0689_2-20121128/24079_1 /TAXON_ID=160604 /ORGANISM="Amphidinium massartii, Strain CS-259" /LENGTH=105 /DNA_ID=CAMNT_0020037813 /DNA_START=96 /DNA_END=414 /DNA_ORIENTATION=+